MKKLKYKMKKIRLFVMVIVTTMINTVNSYAANDGVTQYDNVVNWILGWIGKIGVLVAIWGAVQIAFSFSNEDAGQRRKGILELISGLMLLAIGYGAKTIIGF